MGIPAAFRAPMKPSRRCWLTVWFGWPLMKPKRLWPRLIRCWVSSKAAASLSMRMVAMSGLAMPGATATAAAPAAFTSASTWGDSHRGGGRIRPSTPVFSRRARVAPANSGSAHFSMTIWAPVRLLSSSAPTRNSDR